MDAIAFITNSRVNEDIRYQKSETREFYLEAREFDNVAGDYIPFFGLTGVDFQNILRR